jgi:hypothetical protein
MELVSSFYSNPSLMVRSPHDIFRIVRMLLSDVELWAQGARARDENGEPCKPHSPHACCWSLSGALAIASNPYGVTPPVLLKFLDGIVQEWKLAQCYFRDPDTGYEIWEDCDDYNDNRPHRFLLALLDEAVARTATLAVC